MINKPKKEDIENLLKNEISESKRLDYKEVLLLETSEKRVELLTDIAAFANTSGGDLIYGIIEKRDSHGEKLGVPESICGLENFNFETVKQQIENAMRDSIHPRLSGVQFHKVDGFEKGPVFLIRIPKSLNAPHLVSKGKYSLFYARNNAGKYPLDAGEIRSAFLQSENIWDKIRLFRTERISKIINNEGPLPLDTSGLIVHHVIPLISFQETVNIDFMNFPNLSRTFDPMHSTGRSERYNFNGLLYYCNGTVRDGKHISYIQLFRNGIIETAYLINLRQGERIIAGIQYEKDLLRNTREYIRALSELTVSPPFAVLISLVNVDGFVLAIPNKWRYRDHDTPIDQSNLLLPEVILDDYDDNIEKKLQPIFNIMWQSSGYIRSLNFDTDGNWTQGEY